MSTSQAAMSTSAAGTGLQVAGQIYGAVEAQRLGKYNARVARANAQQDALSAINEAQQHERLAGMLDDEVAFIDSMRLFQQTQLDTALARQEGEVVARIGASGVGFGGSPLAVLEENARQGQMQKLVLDQQARLQTRAVTEEATQQRYAAALAQFGAGQRLRLGRQQAGMARIEGTQRMWSNVFGATGDAIQGYERLHLLDTRRKAM